MKKRNSSATPRAIRGDPTSTYARRVVAGKLLAGPYVRAACARHLRDLEEGHKRGLRWDREKANRAIFFFEKYLRLPGGGPRGVPFKLAPWQRFIVGSIFGWLDKDAYRRFRTAHVEVGKGNGKTPLAAGIGLYMLCADGEQAAEIYTAATMRDQAALCFRDAEQMRMRSPALRKRLLSSRRALTHQRSLSFMMPVSSEAKGLDGKRVHCAVVDELQEHPNSLVIDKMRDGTKGRTQPLIFEIMNSGFDRTSVAWLHHVHSVNVATGVVQDDSWFAYICAGDEGDQPLTDPRCWKKTNPNIGISVTRKYLRQQCAEALAMPARESGVLRVNFCRWVDAASPIFRQVDWDACQAEIDVELLEGLRCIGGLDLSGVNDLTSLCLIFELDQLRDRLKEQSVAVAGRLASASHLILSHFWTPLDTIDQRAKKDGVPYRQWMDEGYLIATPGRAIDYRFVAVKLGELAARFEIERIAYDPYRIKYLEQDLEAEGIEIELVAHGQGYYRSAESHLWMPRSVELLELGVGNHLLLFKRSPVLTWNAASAVLVSDAKENRVFDKRKATGRIDGIVAAAMARGACEEEPEDPVGDFLRNPIMVM